MKININAQSVAACGHINREKGCGGRYIKQILHVNPVLSGKG